MYKCISTRDVRFPKFSLPYYIFFYERWFAKKVDYSTPMYNDSVLYREEYSYYHNISNTYRSNLYNTRDGIPVKNISLISQPTRSVSKRVEKGEGDV